MALEHRLLIFVFRRGRGAIEYLFERRRPTIEYSWTPIRAVVEPSESLHLTALRSMRAQWCAPQPARWVELDVCDHDHVGDLDLIDWGVGYGIDGTWSPPADVRPSSVEFVWRPFAGALRLLELDSTRRALCRLHLVAAA